MQESDGGEKSDGDLVVDVGNEEEPPRPPMPLNGEHRDSTGAGSSNGGAPPGPPSNSGRAGQDGRPSSNLSSSSRSTPSGLKRKEESAGNDGKPGTPGLAENLGKRRSDGGANTGAGPTCDCQPSEPHAGKPLD